MQAAGERTSRASFSTVKRVSERAPIRKRLQDQFDQCEGAQKAQKAPRNETTRRYLRHTAAALVRSFQSMRVTLTDLTQRLKGGTRRRQVMEEEPMTPAMATPRAHMRLLLGRTPTKLYSPFGIDSPYRPAPF